MAFDPNKKGTRSEGKSSGSKASGGSSGFDPGRKGSRSGVTNKSTKKKGFLGINLPDLPTLRIPGTQIKADLPDLPAVGMTTSDGNVLTQLEDMVTGLPKGLGMLGAEVVRKSGKNLLKNPFEEDWKTRNTKSFDLDDSPILDASVRSMEKTVKQFNPQDLVDVAQGDFGDTALGKRIKEEGYLSTAVGTVGDVATLAGGVGLAGKAAGAGRLAEASKLTQVADAAAKHAGVQKGLRASQLDDLARAAEQAGEVGKAGELRHAAQAKGQAERLLSAGTGTRAERLTDVASKVATGGNQLAGGPALVYTKGGAALSKVPGVKQAGRTAGRGVDRLRTTDMAKRMHLDPDGRAFRDLFRREVTRPLESEAYKASTAAQKVNKIIGKDRNTVEALTYVRSGESKRLSPLARLEGDEFEAAVKGIYGDDVNVSAVAKALDFENGTLAADEAAKVTEALRVMQDEWYGPYEQNWFLTGRGSDLTEAGLTERAEQTGSGPMPSTVARLTDEAQQPIRKKIRKLTKERDEVAADLANLQRHLAQGGDEIELSAAQRARIAERRGKVKQLDEQVARERARLDQTRTAGEADVDRVFAQGERRLDVASARGQRAVDSAAVADDARTGRMMDQRSLAGREGVESRSKQAALRQRRLNRQAAVANARGGAEAAGASRAADLMAEGAERATTAAFDATQKSVARQLRKQEKVASTTERRLATAQRELSEAKKRAVTATGKREVAKLSRRVEKLEQKIAGKEYDLGRVADEATRKVAALPKKDRVRVETATRAVKVLQDMADEAEAAAPGSGALFAELISDINTSTLDEFSAGYVPGAKTAAESPTLGQRAKGALPSRALRRRRDAVRLGKGTRLNRTLAGQLEAHGAALRQMVTNDLAPKVQKQMGSTVAAKLADTADMTGSELAAALDEAGLVAWDPSGTGTKLAPKDITAESAVVPKHLFDHYKSYTSTEGGWHAFLTDIVDPGTRAWKHAVLALSPRWHMGNMLGNVMMATVAGGLTPLELVSAGREARKLLRSGSDELAPVLERGGSFFDEAAHLSDKSKVSRFIGGSYKFNQFIDDWHKSTVYLAKRDKGYSPQTAVELALKSAGDFKNMSAFEKNTMRRILPFYAWQRHITKTAVRLPVENPVRVAWMLHLADMAEDAYPDPGQDLPFQDGSVPNFLAGLGIGKEGDRISTRMLNPLTSTWMMGASTRDLGYSMSPFLKAGAVGAFGVSPARAFGPVSTGSSEFGAQPQLGFGLARPAEFAKYLTQMIPQTRQLQDAVAGSSQVRAETGEPTGKDSGRGALEQFGRFLGVPIPETPDPPKKKTLSRGKKRSS